MADYEGWLVSNGDYWKAVIRRPDGSRLNRSLGPKSELSKRQANVKVRDVIDDVRTKDRDDRKPLVLSKWLDTFDAQVIGLGKKTLRAHYDARLYLMAHFTADPLITSITRADAADWQAALASGKLSVKLNEQGAKANAVAMLSGKPSYHWTRRGVPSISTVRKHVRTVKQIFTAAAHQDRIPFNPFDRLVGAVPRITKDWRIVTREEMDRVIEACPHPWRALFGLCRYAGLRRGEALSLRWQDVDWNKNRMVVHATAERETTKARRRIVPIELAKCPTGLTKILGEAFEAAPDGAVLVCQGVATGSMNRNALGIMRRTGVGEYSKPFHTLRKCCETDWAQQYPQHAVSEWIGHDIKVSQAHYLRVPEELYAAPPVSKSGKVKETA